MDSSEIKQLQILATKARMGAILGTFCAKSGHPGGSLSAADIFTYLYFKEMNVDPKNPKWEDRDRFVLSKGHCCPSLYAVLALKGYFEWNELTKLRHVGAMLQGHPDMKGTPGIDMSTGSLGQGISAACGMALSAKISNKSYRVYSVLGDGEVEEGQVWEAAMLPLTISLTILYFSLTRTACRLTVQLTRLQVLSRLTKSLRALVLKCLR